MEFSLFYSFFRFLNGFVLHSLDHFLLKHGVLVELGHMLLRVEFVTAGLRNWHYEAPTQAAAHQDSHDAEIEDHGPLSIHMLNFHIIFLAHIGVARGVLRVYIVLELKDVRSQNFMVFLFHLF